MSDRELAAVARKLHRLAKELGGAASARDARRLAGDLDELAERVIRAARKLYGPTPGSNAQKRRAVIRAVQSRRFRDASCRAVQRALGVSHSMVRAVKLELRLHGTADPAGKGAGVIYRTPGLSVVDDRNDR